MDRWQYGHYAGHFILFLNLKNWLLWQQIYIYKTSGISDNGGAGRGLILLDNSLVLATSDLELSKLDDKLIQILAWQRLQQLMPGKTSSTESERRRSGSINGLLTTPGTHPCKHKLSHIWENWA
ncbi:hypothetical protein DPMN_013671 [Dreissena polymorpha]|uniref:Uncharacterized protein n=1 Tax=Dreissena polymorpha TaxID=45954 RepID=A0A9D4N4M6_DREPO|nr:hypothetical protein DPMN_013671 [Dreissena polymorpha]